MNLGILSIAFGLTVSISAPASTSVPQPEQPQNVISHRHLHREGHVPAAEKNALFAEAGIPKGERKYYRVDHKVPLELGGTRDRNNLQVQTKPEARAKDRIEHYLIEKVRRGDMSLDEAREKIVDWKHVSRY